MIEQLMKDVQDIRNELDKSKRNIKVLQFTNFVMLVAFLVWFMMEGV